MNPTVDPRVGETGALSCLTSEFFFPGRQEPTFFSDQVEANEDL